MTHIRPLQISKALLKPILEARQCLALVDGRPQEAVDDDAASVAFGLAHAIHVLGLRDLVEGNKIGEKPNAIRVLESNGADITAYYDVSTSGSNPEVMQMAGLANNYAAVLEPGIELAVRWAQDRAGETEFRLLRIPALYTEALGLRTKGEKEETAIVIRTLQAEVEILKPMPLSELMARLEAAARLILESNDR